MGARRAVVQGFAEGENTISDRQLERA